MDKSWLLKKANLYNSYALNVFDNITKQMVIELEELFDWNESSDKVLQFKIVSNDSDLKLEGFKIIPSENSIEIIARDSKGLLYGLYEVHRLSVLSKLPSDEFISNPDQSIRMINHWDNMDGTIERGYAGESIFYKDNQFRRNVKLIEEYSRLLASVGINALSINNVNVHKVETKLITEDFIPELMLMNEIFNRFGIKMFLSINFASPKIVGGLASADPLNRDVQNFWKKTIDRLYHFIPTFGGFVIKADSEGEPGPFAYGRTHAEGANMFGKLLEPHNGLCIWRCFVYNSTQDWRDRSTDRARAAYDHFMPYDGQFLDNVILQIKLGALDFQVKEPVSPLFGALKNTNHIVEFQLTQEYTGQQKAIYYQLPVWKEVLDFNTRHEGQDVYVKHALKQNSPVTTNSGICAVGVVGTDDNWTGHKLMQINLFGYGRLAWNNELTTEEISKEWVNLTFNLPNELSLELQNILNTSRETYRLYNAPNGVGFMCRPNHHYGPDIDGYEFDRWGTYHFADRNGIGVNRSSSGTGYVKQYSPEICEMYDNLMTCPDDLLLWFHFVPYTHRLQNGKTLIQDIYDNHFEGVERVKEYQKQWEKFENYITKKDFINVKERLEEQYRISIEWRDQINTYFYRKSGISDLHGRKIY